MQLNSAVSVGVGGGYWGEPRQRRYGSDLRSPCFERVGLSDCYPTRMASDRGGGIWGSVTRGPRQSTHFEAFSREWTGQWRNTRGTAGARMLQQPSSQQRAKGECHVRQMRCRRVWMPVLIGPCAAEGLTPFRCGDAIWPMTAVRRAKGGKADRKIRSDWAKRG